VATAERIRVLVADDEETVRDVLEALLGSEPEIDLIGSAADTETAIELACKELPDVALVDVRMPGGGGPRATREIVRRSPPTRVIALSAHQDVPSVLTMLRAGAVGYVVKSDSVDEILSAIHGAVEGKSSVPQRLAAGVASAMLEHVLQGRREASRSSQLRRKRVERAIDDRAFTMVFQPIFDLDGGAIVGMEALARFSELPQRTPNVWIAEAEAVGLLMDLELALAGAALDELESLPPDAYLALNFSPETAASDRLRDLLERADPSRIVVEVTEQAPVADYDELREALSGLRERGVRLAIDDAGAGFASLRHIVRLDPDLIKLDITLTRQIETDPVRQALAVALVSFAEQIGATVVAEGVETELQLEALRRAGVRHAQGFLLGRPGPVAEVGSGRSLEGSSLRSDMAETGPEPAVMDRPTGVGR
jgi:EAL domain-containing protein (putative c-di-GMP-specific phosphodiesterase class I)/DNA-binding NarL/FixJ family response regulator